MSDTAIAVPAATATNTRPQKRHKRPSVSLVQWLTLAIVALFVVVPFYTTLLGGFKGIGELRTNPFGLPQVWDPSNFLGILFGPTLFHSLWNSLFISLATVALSILLASMAAFAFAHIRFFGSKFLMNFLLLGLLFPSATAILPLFIKMRDLGLLDSHLGIIVVQVAFSQRRKLLRHTLGQWLERNEFAGHFDLQRRAEEVPVAEYIALCQELTRDQAGF